MLSHWISFPPDRWGRWGYSEAPRSLWFLQVAASANHFQWRLRNIWNICDSSKRLRLKNDRCHSNQEAAVIWRSDGFSRRGRLQNLSAERWLLKESESDVKSNQVSTLHQCTMCTFRITILLYPKWYNKWKILRYVPACSVRRNRYSRMYALCTPVTFGRVTRSPLTIPSPKDSPFRPYHLKSNTHAAFGGPGKSSEDMEPEVRPKRVQIFRGIISICNICKLLIYLV